MYYSYIFIAVFELLNIYLVNCEKLNLTVCCDINRIYDVKEKMCVLYDGDGLRNLTIYDSSLFETDKRIEDVFQFHENTSLIKSNDFINLDLAGIGRINKYLSEDGVLHQEYPNFYDRFSAYKPGDFCISNVRKRNKTTVGFWIRVEYQETFEQDPHLTISCMYVSSLFFVVILVVYGCLPDLRNLHGMILMAYVASMLAAFLSLATLQLLTVLNENHPILCLIFSPMIYFFFLASFCWMNVMSFDIWWTFRGYAKARLIHRRGELFKFFTYCAYSWGVPLAMTAGFEILNTVDVQHIPWLIVPNIPLTGCFLSGGQKFLYLYVPMLLVLIINWILFLMTGFNIWRINRDTSVLNAGGNQAHRSQHQRFSLYLKLSVVMGVNWVLEILSLLWPTSYIWKLTDAYNLMIGLNIFIIFICKRKIFEMLKKRIKGDNRRPHSSWKGSMRSSRSTSSGFGASDSDDDTTLQISLNPKGNYSSVVI